MVSYIRLNNITLDNWYIYLYNVYNISYQYYKFVMEKNEIEK